MDSSPSVGCMVAPRREPPNSAWGRRYGDAGAYAYHTPDCNTWYGFGGAAAENPLGGNRRREPKTNENRVHLTGLQIRWVGLLVGASRGNQPPIPCGARRRGGADWSFLLAIANKLWYTSCTRKLEVASIFGVTGGAVCPWGAEYLAPPVADGQSCQSFLRRKGGTTTQGQAARRPAPHSLSPQARCRPSRSLNRCLRAAGGHSGAPGGYRGTQSSGGAAG